LDVSINSREAAQRRRKVYRLPAIAGCPLQSMNIHTEQKWSLMYLDQRLGRL